MAYTIANNVKTTINQDVSAGDTSIVLNAASSPHNNPPSPSASALMTLMDHIAQPNKIEIISYTSVTDNGDGTYTISGVTKGLEGTSDQSWNSGDYAMQSLTADFINKISQPANIYGIRWNKSADEWTRLYSAEGLTAGSDFDSIMPWAGMKRCNVADDGTINAYYGDAGFAYDGSNGQVMVEIPAFWYKTEILKDGTVDFLVSPEWKQGFKRHPAFVRDGQVLDYIYIAAFEGHYNSGESAMESIANVVPSTDTGTHDTYGTIDDYPDATIVGCRGDAQARGSNWEQREFMGTNAVYYLLVVEYATFDTQSAIGRGVVDKDSGTDHNGEKTGQTAGFDGGTDLGNSSGTANTGVGNGYESISYRGIENLWGNIWEWCDGLNIKSDHKPWIADHGFASDTFADPYEPLGITLPSSNGYGSDVVLNEICDFGFLTLEINGSSGSGLFDYYYQNTGDRVARVGGHWNYSLNAGTFYWNLNNSSTNSNQNIGTHLLCVLFNFFFVFAPALAEHKKPLKFGLVT